MLRNTHPGDHVLVLALDVQLSRRRQARVAAHVASCGPCQLRAEQLRSTVADAHRLYRLADKAAAPSSSEARRRLEHALQQAGEEWDGSWWTRWRHLIAVPPPAVGRAAAAGCAALVVVWLAGVGGPPASRVLHYASSRDAASSPLPVASLTPGAVSSLTAAELCAGTRTARTVSDDVRRRVLAGYGMENAPADRYELDALVTPELGGTAEPKNLWPQPYASPVWNAHVKDALEQLLAGEVCQGRMPLAEAQREIATDWVAAYKRHFHTQTPWPAHARATSTDDDLEVESPPSVPSIAALAPARLDLLQ